jgi:hypothetical protein
MRKLIVVFTGLAVVSTSALAQVTPVTVSAALAQMTPENCRPIFPFADDLAQVQPIQNDVLAERALPVAESRRSIFGLPLLPFLLASGVGVAALADDDDNGPAALST